MGKVKNTLKLLEFLEKRSGILIRNVFLKSYSLQIEISLIKSILYGKGEILVKI